jgi:hypothetical protein
VNSRHVAPWRSLAKTIHQSTLMNLSAVLWLAATGSPVDPRDERRFVRAASRRVDALA